MPAELLRYRGWTGNQIENRYSHWIWRQYASAFWDDVRLDRVLPFREARDEEDEKHVHPLQLDVIDRCARAVVEPGETVLTPFMGVGSEVYGAVSQRPPWRRHRAQGEATTSRRSRTSRKPSMTVRSTTR